MSVAPVFARQADSTRDTFSMSRRSNCALWPAWLSSRHLQRAVVQRQKLLRRLVLSFSGPMADARSKTPKKAYAGAGICLHCSKRIILETAGGLYVHEDSGELHCTGVKEFATLMLNTECDTPEMRTRIEAAFYASKYHNTQERYQFDFEHGQWWVTELGTGQQWSVVDALGGQAVGGFDFEQVSVGSGG